MNKMIISRRDHEVYFISEPKGLKAKQLKSLVIEQLDKLHPGFSSASVFDIQHIVFDKARWIMVTVMKTETLTEYRILYKQTALYTNTSIAVHKKNFTQTGIITIDDERIGFDTEISSPVSYPLEKEKNDVEKELIKELNSIPSRHGVFVKRIPKQLVLSLAAAMALIIFTFSFFYIASANKRKVVIVEAPIEIHKEIKYFPPAIETLAKLSLDILKEAGSIIRWQYNEETEPLMLVQLLGIDGISAHKIMNQYEYARLLDIQNVNYSDGKPQITIQVTAATQDYSIASMVPFPVQSSTLSIIRELTGALQKEGVVIISEALPAKGNPFYTITYNTAGRNFIKSLEVFNEICEKYALSQKKLDISLGGDKNTFTVVFALAYRGIAIALPEKNDKSKIPLAFGYRTPAPETVKAPEKKPEPPAIGSIRGAGGQVVFYRDFTDGKMKTREK